MQRNTRENAARPQLVCSQGLASHWTKNNYKTVEKTKRTNGSIFTRPLVHAQRTNGSIFTRPPVLQCTPKGQMVPFSRSHQCTPPPPPNKGWIVHSQVFYNAFWAPPPPIKDAAFLLTVGSFLLTMELFYLQLTI